MDELLVEPVDSYKEFSLGLLEMLTRRMLLSFLFGCAVAVIYVFTHRKRWSELAPMVTTLVMLTVLLTMVTLVINGNLARAFSLVGALAIVRFRTVVEDTRDTAYVIFAVAVGMGIGVGLLIIPLVGTPIVAGAAFLLAYLSKLGQATAGPPNCDYSLEIRLGLGRDPAELLRTLFDRYLTMVRLKSTMTARQGSALDLGYTVKLRCEDDAVAFVTALNQVEGIQTVDLRQL